MSLFNTTVIGGVDTSDATATAGDVLSPKTFYLENGEKATGTILSKGAQTYTPTTANQTITQGQFLSGAQTIAGSSNLIASNIKQGVNLFGVLGNFAGAKQLKQSGGIYSFNFGSGTLNFGFHPLLLLLQSNYNGQAQFLYVHYDSEAAPLIKLYTIQPYFSFLNDIPPNATSWSFYTGGSDTIQGYFYAIGY